MSEHPTTPEGAYSAATQARAAEDASIVQARLEHLEVKASYADDMLEQLNLTIYQQQQLIERLVREVTQIKHDMNDGAASGARHLRDELPPHY